MEKTYFKEPLGTIAFWTAIPKNTSEQCMVAHGRQIQFETSTNFKPYLNFT